MFANTRGSRSPARIDLMMRMPVMPVISVITLCNWMFISVRAFCICKTCADAYEAGCPDDASNCVKHKPDHLDEMTHLGVHMYAVVVTIDNQKYPLMIGSILCMSGVN